MRLELGGDEEKRRGSDVHSHVVMAAVVVALTWLLARAYGA